MKDENGNPIRKPFPEALMEELDGRIQFHQKTRQEIQAPVTVALIEVRNSLAVVLQQPFKWVS